MDFVTFSFIIAGALIIIAAIIHKLQHNNHTSYHNTTTSDTYTAYTEQTPVTQNIQNTYMPYRRKNLLTKTEYIFYNTLKQVCDKYNLLICPKVRLEDIAEVTDKQNLMKYRGYIKSRHVDFILCDNKLYGLCAIELDDYSHNYSNAQATDEFKNNLFNAIKLPLFRIKVGCDYNRELEDIMYLLVVQNQKSSLTPASSNEHNDISKILEKQNLLLEKQNSLLEEIKSQHKTSNS